jgi:hypothetical protein
MPNMRVLFLFLFLLSCGNEKVIQLPEIQNAKITTITDVSPAYIFYDETKPDSVELNRKNLIISTNWLVNVDKRLTLKQALPSIIKLQDKKRNAILHKNENAKNYFTCNDTSIENLGFIDFTDVVYDYDYDYEGEEIGVENNYSIAVVSLNNIIIFALNGLDYDINLVKLENDFDKIFSQHDERTSISLSFNNKLSFQEYITFKSFLSDIRFDDFRISPIEFIFD